MTDRDWETLGSFIWGGKEMRSCVICGTPTELRHIGFECFVHPGQCHRTLDTEYWAADRRSAIRVLSSGTLSLIHLPMRGPLRFNPRRRQIPVTG